MSNYYIGVDEYGLPYIEHKRDTKYVAKVGHWPKVRYFYSNEEYRAYLNQETGNKAAQLRDAAFRASSRSKYHMKNKAGESVITNGKKGKARVIKGKRYNPDGSLTALGREDAQASARMNRAAWQYAGIAQLFGAGYTPKKKN